LRTAKPIKPTKRQAGSAARAPKTARRKPAAKRQLTAAGDDRIEASGLSLHDLFAQQVRAVLDRADLDEEQKQSLLIATSCPCCSAGSLSFSVRIKRRS
jgi:hypothetical protein